MVNGNQFFKNLSNILALSSLEQTLINTNTSHSPLSLLIKESEKRHDLLQAEKRKRLEEQRKKKKKGAKQSDPIIIDEDDVNITVFYDEDSDDEHQIIAHDALARMK